MVFIFTARAVNDEKLESLMYVEFFVGVGMHDCRRWDNCMQLPVTSEGAKTTVATNPKPYVAFSFVCTVHLIFSLSVCNQKLIELGQTIESANHVMK